MKSSGYELKRDKISYACGRCRKRKIKCDRKLPSCSSCSELGETGSCKYESDKWQTDLMVYEPGNAQLRKEVGVLRTKIRLLENTVSTQRVNLDAMERNTRDELNLYDETDEAKLKVNMSNFHSILLKNLRLTYYGPTNYLSLLMNDPYGTRLFAKYAELQEKKLIEIESHSSLDYSVLKQNRIEPDTEDCSRIPEPLQMQIPLIPRDKTLIYLVERFFQICYPLAPFLDKDNFMKSISPLWENGGYSQNNIILLKCGTLASLLIVLRFSSLSLSSERYLVEPEVAIPSTYVEYSKVLLLSSKGSGRINLSIIQAILLLRTYKTICPEDDNESTDTRILLGIATDMAIIQGLSLNTRMNRFISKDELYIRKKLWLQLFYDDASNSFNFGIQTSICEFETEEFAKLLEEVGTPVENEKKYITRQFKMKIQVASLIRKVVLLMNHRNQEISVSEVTNILNDFDRLLHEEMYSFDQLINYDSSFTSSEISYRVLEYIMKIDLYYKSFMLYYFLFLNWDNDISLDYSRAHFLHLALEKGIILTLLGDYFTKDKSFFFGPEFEKLVGTCIWSSLAKIIPSMVCLLCRSLDGEYNIFMAFKNFKSSCFDIMSWANIDCMDNTSSIKNILKKYQDIYQKCVQLHTKYFITYKVCVCLHFSLDFIQNTYPTFFQDIFSKTSNSIEELASFLDSDNHDTLKNFIDYNFDYNLFLTFLEDS